MVGRVPHLRRLPRPHSHPVLLLSQRVEGEKKRTTQMQISSIFYEDFVSRMILLMALLTDKHAPFLL